MIFNKSHRDIIEFSVKALNSIKSVVQNRLPNGEYYEVVNFTRSVL